MAYNSIWTTEIFNFNPKGKMFDPFLFEKLHWDGYMGDRRSRLHINKFNYLRPISTALSGGFYAFLSLSVVFLDSDAGEIFFFVCFCMTIVEQFMRFFVCYLNIKQLHGLYKGNLLLRCIANLVMNTLKITFFGTYIGFLKKRSLLWSLSPLLFAFMLSCISTFQFIFCCKAIPHSLKRCFSFQKGKEFHQFGAVLSTYLFLAFVISMMARLVEWDHCHTGTSIVISLCFLGCAMTIYFAYVLVKPTKELILMYDWRAARQIK